MSLLHSVLTQLGFLSPQQSFPPGLDQLLEHYHSVFSTNPLLPAALRDHLEAEQPWKRNLRNMEDASYEVADADIEGTLPSDLQGTLFANGAGDIGVPQENGDMLLFGHWFDCDGRIMKLTLKDGKVRFECKLLATPRVLAQKGHDYVTWVGAWTLAQGGRYLSNAVHIPTNCVNTSVMNIGDRFYALAEGGLPLEFDPTTLDAKSLEDFGGKLESTDFFSAHYKVCPKTGHIFAYGVSFQHRGIAAYHLSPTGECLQRSVFKLDHFGMVHDYVLTDNYMVFHVTPCVVPMTGAIKMFGLGRSLGECLEWKPELGSTIAIIRREDLSVVKIFPIEPIFNYHFGNGYESPENPNRIIFPIIRQMDPQTVDKHFGMIYFANFKSFVVGQMQQLEIDISEGTLVSVTPVSRGMVEFPSFNTNYQGQPNRFHYAAAFVNLSHNFFDGVEKMDIKKERGVVFEAPEGCVLLEPLFVPRENCKDEEDGYLLVSGYDTIKHRNIFLIVDARTMKTVTRINLRGPHGYLFHSMFVHNKYYETAKKD